MWVTSKFGALRVDDKKMVCKVVFEFVFEDANDSTGTIRIYDSLTDKKIGDFDGVFLNWY